MEKEREGVGDFFETRSGTLTKTSDYPSDSPKCQASYFFFGGGAGSCLAAGGPGMSVYT